MLQTIKKQIRLQLGDWLLVAGCMLVMWVIGVVFLFIMQRVDPEDTNLALGTMLAAIGGAGAGTLMMLFNLGLNFNTQISLGNRRMSFFVSYYITWLFGFFICFGILLLASVGENAAHAALWPDTAMAADMTEILVRFGAPCCILLPAFGTFWGALMLRYKRKAFWVLWVLWMLGAIGIPNAMDAAESAKQSVLGKAGLALQETTRVLFGSSFPALAIVLSILFLAASALLLRRQQVEP